MERDHISFHYDRSTKGLHPLKIPVQWRSIDNGMVRVIFNLEGVTGISGSGQMDKIGLEVIGDTSRIPDHAAF